MGKLSTDIKQLTIDTIRVLTADAVQKANSGHPGMPMGAAPMAQVLWTEFLLTPTSGMAKPGPLYFVCRTWLSTPVYLNVFHGV
jgi:hypothetical protein